MYTESREAELKINDIADIKRYIAEGRFSFLKNNNVFTWLNEMINTDEITLIKQLIDRKAISEEQLYSTLLAEEPPFPMMEKLRSNGLATDSDIYYEAIEIGNSVIENEEYLELLEKFPRDGSLAIYDSEDIWHMTNPNSVPLIEWFIKAGVDIDHNQFLIYTFAGDHYDVFELFDLLIENFTEFTQEALMSTCVSLLYSIEDNPETETNNAITTLLKKIDSLDTVFGESAEESDYYSLFGAFLLMAPQLLLSLDEISDDYIPSQSALEEIDWDFVVNQGEFDEQHLLTLKALMARGAQFPLEEIIEALEESDRESFAAELKPMIK